jgi:hypothetical protein
MRGQGDRGRMRADQQQKVQQVRVFGQKSFHISIYLDASIWVYLTNINTVKPVNS